MEDAAAEWLIHGHGWLGERALRRFKVRGQPDALALGRITRWQREDVEAGDGALFHCVHDDGDEEDLEAEEARLIKANATADLELQVALVTPAPRCLAVTPTPTRGG